MGSDGLAWVNHQEHLVLKPRDSASERVAYLAVLQRLRRVTLPFEWLGGWFDFVATEQSK